MYFVTRGYICPGAGTTAKCPTPQPASLGPPLSPMLVWLTSTPRVSSPCLLEGFPDLPPHKEIEQPFLPPSKLSCHPVLKWLFPVCLPFRTVSSWKARAGPVVSVCAESLLVHSHHASRAPHVGRGWSVSIWIASAFHLPPSVSWPSSVKGTQASSPTCLPEVLLREACFQSL